MVVWWAIRAEPRDEQPAIDGARLGYSSLARLDTIEPDPGGDPGPIGAARRKVAHRPAAIRGDARR